MQVLFTTNNKSKFGFYEAGFNMADESSKMFNFISKNDPSLQDKVKFEVKMDDEKDAESYSKELDMLTVNVNESLYIEGLNEKNQPGKYYKMLKTQNEDGTYSYKDAKDEDLINHYAQIVEELGGTCNAKFVDHVSVCYKGKVIKKFNVENDAVFTSNASKVIKKGNPLSSITLIPEFGDIHKSECDDNEEELLFETRDKKALKKIAKEVKEVIETLNNNNNDNNDDNKDFLHNKVEM